jgi:hypothetical protein
LTTKKGRALPRISLGHIDLTAGRALFAKESMPRLSRYWHLLQRGKPSKEVFDRRKATAAIGACFFAAMDQ